MTTMGNRFGVQGLGTKPIHSLRDLDNFRTPEVSRPTEDPVTVNRIPVDSEDRYEGDRRRHTETAIPQLQSTVDEPVHLGDGAERGYFSKVQTSEVRNCHTMSMIDKKINVF